MKRFKKINKGRGVTIPKDIAAHLDLKPGDTVDLTAAGNGDLIIRHHTEACRFCRGTENIKRFSDIAICPLCATKMYQEVCG